MIRLSTFVDISNQLYKEKSTVMASMLLLTLSNVVFHPVTVQLMPSVGLTFCSCWEVQLLQNVLHADMESWPVALCLFLPALSVISRRLPPRQWQYVRFALTVCFWFCVITFSASKLCVSDELCFLPPPSPTGSCPVASDCGSVWSFTLGTFGNWLQMQVCRVHCGQVWKSSHWPKCKNCDLVTSAQCWTWCSQKSQAFLSWQY